MNDATRFEGKNLEAAIGKACEHFDVEEDNLEISVIDAGSSGIFGLGGRSTIIEARVKNDMQELEQTVREVLGNLLEPIVEQPNLDIRANEKRLYVTIQDEENSGLIIGKEGQNIAALEYLTNLIVSKKEQDKVYIQLDAGGYRQKQEELVKETALNLAKKVKETGKPQSTRPMSSYQRRLVHLALQDDTEIATRSKGDGALKRVTIFSKKKKGGGQAQTE